MWNWIRCYVTGHDYCVSCERGSMFLRCIVCERRSQGWEVSAKSVAHARQPDRALTAVGPLATMPDSPMPITAVLVPGTSSPFPLERPRQLQRSRPERSSA